MADRHQTGCCSPVGSHWAFLGPVSFSIFINDLDAGQKGYSVNLLMTLLWEELLAPSKAERPCRATSRDYRDGPSPYAVKEGQVLDSALGWGNPGYSGMRY